MAMTRAQQLRQLEPGLNALFGMEYKVYENQHAAIYETESSERAFEEEVKLAGFAAAPVKAEGQSIAYDDGAEAWAARYNHETIALGFAITEEAMEDNLYESLGKRYTKALARAMAHTKQVKAAAILNNGFTTFNSGDGVTLFNTAHPTTGGPTNANRPLTAVDMNETSVENAAIQIALWTDERGLLIASRPRKMVVHPSNMFAAKRILDSDLQPDTASNNVNALKALMTIPQGYTVNHFLTDTDAWFLLTDVPNGLKHFQRVPLSQKMDGDFDTGNVRYKARERYSFGVSDPLGVWGSPGA